MRYAELLLKGYKRLQLNQVETFILRPTQIVQLILGTNGSGKSSLLRELTPLPANSADFAKDGKKAITIEDRGHTYVLTNDFGAEKKHSFIKDEEELNHGGTAAVQKELVKQEFQITNDTHELVTGLEIFTQMSPSRRREWFTQLSDVNYDYAISRYNRLREEFRNVSGALKLDKKQLVVEQSKVITEEEQQRLIQEVRALHVEMTRLIEMRSPIERPIEQVDRDRLAAEEQLRLLSERLLRLRVEAPMSMVRNEWGELQRATFASVGAVDQHVENIRHQITAQEAVLSKSVTDHEKLKENADILKRRGTDGVKSVQLRITAAREARDELLKGRQLGLEGFDPRAALKALDSVDRTLEGLLMELPVNEDQRFSSAKLNEQREISGQVKQQRTAKAAEVAHWEGKKQHLEQHKANGRTECPKCHHVFTQGVSEEAFTVLTNQIEKAKAELRGLDERLAGLDEVIGTNQSYGELFREVQLTLRGTPALSPFWDHVLETRFLQSAPKRVVTLLHALRQDLELELKAQRHIDEIGELQKLLVQSEELGDASLAEVTQQLGEASLVIESLTKALAGARQQLHAFQTYRRQLTEAFELQFKIEQTVKSFETFTHHQVETLRRMAIQRCLEQTQSALARKEEILNVLNQQKAIVANLTLTIARRTLEEEALKMTVRALSPTDGLIADGLLGFIKSFTQQMNQLIRKIWAYPLEILPCGMSSDRGTELDYKFPLMVGTRSNVVDDIKRGSSGMQEIVDLAFKVVAMKYLGLDHGALPLDEFGKTLDMEHRTTAMQAVKQLMETRPFTQLFLINHYSELYGSFTNAEVCVLDSRNIAVPQTYNTHVTMH
ncbi:hypothetical protein [Paraburkholderia sp. BCC1886]|uniref:hypothetical protein n=1 Tax=Paraburkholderia sp. BCC1886 TaxID=2562670 RepID=UPI001182082A|nr:hypothetical protein [Paraburkholderia sp. BCC1886]